MTQPILTPNVHYLCAGAAEGITPLSAFDGALIAAGVGNVNLVRMSSILPPRSLEIKKPERLPYGALVPVAYASITSPEVGPGVSRGIAAAVAVAVPLDPDLPGLIMELSSSDMDQVDAESLCREMAKDGLHRRKWDIDYIKSASSSIETGARPVAAFAAVVLWRA
jgi:arginine decarboxylase